MPRLAFVGFLLLTISLRCCHKAGHVPPPPAHPVADIAYDVLDARERGLLLTVPTVTPANVQDYWAGTLNASQRVEFAAGINAVEEIENARHWQAIYAVTGISGKDPSASSEQQFNNQVLWEKHAAQHFERLPCWGVHIALLHPGQYGYQENRDGNPFLGMVVLFDEDPKDPNHPGGQFHIGFRSWLAHYEAENGDIGNPENYQLYGRWYGFFDSFMPGPSGP